MPCSLIFVPPISMVSPSTMRGLPLRSSAWTTVGSRTSARLIERVQRNNLMRRMLHDKYFYDEKMVRGSMKRILMTALVGVVVGVERSAVKLSWYCRLGG